MIFAKFVLRFSCVIIEVVAIRQCIIYHYLWVGLE